MGFHEPVYFHNILAELGHHNTSQSWRKPANGDNIRA